MQIKVDWLPPDEGGLCQIYATGLEYCFVSSNNRQVCPMVYCKDFLQDALWAWHNKSSVEIYGFTYARKTGIPICSTQTRIALGNGADAKFSNKIPAMMEFLNFYERKLKLMRTTAIKVSNPPSKYKSGVWLLESSRRWMIAPPMLSLYGLLIRVGCNHRLNRKIETTIKKLLSGDEAPYQSHDRDYFDCAQNGIEYIVKHGYARVFYSKSPAKNYPKSIDVDEMHDCTGIVAFSGKIKEKFNTKPKAEYSANHDLYAYAAEIPHWYRKLTPKKKAKAKVTT